VLIVLLLAHGLSRCLPLYAGPVGFHDEELPLRV